MESQSRRPNGDNGPFRIEKSSRRRLDFTSCNVLSADDISCVEWQLPINSLRLQSLCEIFDLTGLVHSINHWVAQRAIRRTLLTRVASRSLHLP